MTCEVRNLSSLGDAEFAALSTAFQDELQRRSIRIVPSDAPVVLILSVTQNPAEHIGVVQIQRKDDPETIMETLGPVKGLTAFEPALSLALHKEFLFSQEGPILDVVFAVDGELAFALGAQEISSYRLRDEGWVRSGGEVLPRQHPPGRSEAGFLFLGTDTEAVYFPGELCRISAVDRKGWSCETRPEQMPVRSVSDTVMSGKKTGPWFSAAQFDADGKPSIVLTGQDGLARLYEEAADPVAVFPDWGSQIASVHSGCAAGWQLVVTGAADWTKADAIRAVEIKEHRAQPVSAPMELPGPIVALHTLGTRTVENASANAKVVAVDRNLQTGRYEAFLLSITCSN